MLLNSAGNKPGGTRSPYLPCEEGTWHGHTVLFPKMMPESPHRENIHKSRTGDIFNMTGLSLQHSSSRVCVKKDAKKTTALTELWGAGGRGVLSRTVWGSPGRAGQGLLLRDITESAFPFWSMMLTRGLCPCSYGASAVRSAPHSAMVLEEK